MKRGEQEERPSLFFLGNRNRRRRRCQIFFAASRQGSKSSGRVPVARFFSNFRRVRTFDSVPLPKPKRAERDLPPTRREQAKKGAPPRQWLRQPRRAFQFFFSLRLTCADVAAQSRSAPTRRGNADRVILKGCLGGGMKSGRAQVPLLIGEEGEGRERERKRDVVCPLLLLKSLG